MLALLGYSALLLLELGILAVSAYVASHAEKRRAASPVVSAMRAETPAQRPTVSPRSPMPGSTASPPSAS